MKPFVQIYTNLYQFLMSLRPTKERDDERGYKWVGTGQNKNAQKYTNICTNLFWDAEKPWHKQICTNTKTYKNTQSTLAFRTASTILEYITLDYTAISTNLGFGIWILMQFICN